MKPNSIVYLIITFSTLMSACSDNHVTPQVNIIPLRVEEAGYTRELSYDKDGKLKQILSLTVMADETRIETFHRFTYSTNGSVSHMEIDENLFTYTYTDGRVVREDHYVGEQLHRYQLFTLTPSGQLYESVWYKVIAPGIAVPDQKEVYQYDLAGNVVNQKTYVFVAGNFTLQSEYEFFDYDSKQSVDDLFGGPNGLSLATKTVRHNPGKMITKNSTGVIGKIEQYDYTYNELDLALKRTTSVTFHLTGATGSYDTHYFYK